MDVDFKEDFIFKIVNSGFEVIVRGYNREKMFRKFGVVLLEVL